MKSKKNTTVNKSLPPSFQRMLEKWMDLLQQVAFFLQEKTNSYSSGKKKFALYLFCLAFCSLSVLVVVHSLKDKTAWKGVTSIKPIPLAYPTPFINRNVKTKELLRIHLFKLYLDSLNETELGKKKRDSLLNHRPKLLDTLQFLENLYYEENKSNNR